MSNTNEVLEKYLLFHFSIVRPDGDFDDTSQKSTSLGEYDDIEMAFYSAYKFAAEEMRKANLSLTCSVKYDNLRIKSTEFGYDLVNDIITISRYWIHIKETK